MPWFKVDDTFPHHAKVLAAGNAAIGLWARAGAWSMQQLTDGYIPTHVARTMGSAVEAKRLVDAGLWLIVKDGYLFHQWADRQPSRETVEADRHAARERQRKGRERQRSRRESQEESLRDIVRTSSVSHGGPDPTRPDPSRSSSGTTNADPPKRATQLPTDFEPNDNNREVAANQGVDLAAVVAQFSDHHRAKGSTYKDWNLALNTWIRREKPGTARPPQRRLPHVSELETPPDGLSEAEYSAWLRERRGA